MYVQNNKKECCLTNQLTKLNTPEKVKHKILEYEVSEIYMVSKDIMANVKDHGDKDNADYQIFVKTKITRACGDFEIPEDHYDER